MVELVEIRGHGRGGRVSSQLASYWPRRRWSQPTCASQPALGEV